MLINHTHPCYGGDEVSAAAAATVEGEGDVGGCRRRRWGPTAATGEGHDGGLKKGQYSIEKVSSVDNIADILTKPLKRESFNYLRLGLGMMEHIP
ncbi:hypothetical protein Tco_1466833 [Tanacetum coccineum]